MASTPIKLIVGLGNPGPEYEQTPHNAGFWFVDEVARIYHAQLKSDSKFHGDIGKVHIAGQDCWLLKPMTFMNRSGQAVNALTNYYKIDQSEVLVAHDELDFPAGKVRLKKGGGHGGHNGLRDIMPGLGKDFYRLRIGVGHPGNRDQVTGHLLSRASKDVMDAAIKAIDQSLDVLELLVAGDNERAMHALHSEK
jgi:PTH1 family peptidyl-tRNA hydrolase